VDQAGVLRKIKRDNKDIYAINPPVKRKKRNSDVRVIAVTSGKGGVGKTNIAANLAYILSKWGKRVLLLDADAGLANVDVILGITPQHNMSHILHGEKTLSEVIIHGPGGMKILPAASGIQEMTELSRGHKLTLIEELDDLNENLDFMFVDTGAGIAGNVMYFNMLAKEIIVVVSPEPTSLTDGYALIKILHQGYGAKRFMILVNMANNSGEAVNVYKRLSKTANDFLNVSIEYIGYVPCDTSVQKSVRQQSLLSEIFPSSKAGRQFFLIAEKLCMKQVEESEKGMMKFFGNVFVDRND